MDNQNFTEKVKDRIDKVSHILEANKVDWTSRYQWLSSIGTPDGILLKVDSSESDIVPELIDILGSDDKIQAEKGIQPVDWYKAGYRIPAPVIFSNDGEPHYCDGDERETIDILARTGRGIYSSLTVVETMKTGDARDAMLRAVSYGVFIRELIRNVNACGQQWFKSFGIGQDVDEPKTIVCMVAMPEMSEDDMCLFKEIGETGTSSIMPDKIKLGYLSLDTETCRVMKSTLVWKDRRAVNE